jgi:hypothetical protein
MIGFISKRSYVSPSSTRRYSSVSEKNTNNITDLVNNWKATVLKKKETSHDVITAKPLEALSTILANRNRER